MNLGMKRAPFLILGRFKEDLREKTIANRTLEDPVFGPATIIYTQLGKNDMDTFTSRTQKANLYTLNQPDYLTS